MSGFAPFGNFWNYYTFNLVQERLQYIKIDEVVQGIVGTRSSTEQGMSVLDIGCNEGDVTLAVLGVLRNREELKDDKINVLGVDIDAQLIERARAKSKELPVDFLQLDFLDSDAPSTFLIERGSGMLLYESFDTV